MASDALSEPDRLILEAGAGTRQLAPDELQQIAEYAAQAGFDPNAKARVGGRLRGIVWQGRILQGSEMLSPAEVHYLRHVVAVREWPLGTTLGEYLESIRQVIMSSNASLMVSQYGHHGWQLGVITPSGQWRGPDGGEFIMVEYRMTIGHWVTAYQFSGDIPQVAQRRDQKWLRRR
ncbi:MAG: hypothetical protein EXR50_06080 [Dehalococcoidia bacterium]|nr:hypothetical protein [Dehalococcoidia bacterium]